MGKELSNLYALAKQVNSYFDGSDISFLSERAQRILANYVAFSCRNEEETAQTLRNLQVNPGNTIDSVAEQILENLHEITMENGYDDRIREWGFMLSLHRLMAYHEANIENIPYIVEAAAEA